MLVGNAKEYRQMMENPRNHSRILPLLRRQWRIIAAILVPIAVDLVTLAGLGCMTGELARCDAYYPQRVFALIATLHFISAFLITPIAVAGHFAPMHHNPIPLSKIFSSIFSIYLPNIALMSLLSATMVPGIFVTHRFLAASLVILAFISLLAGLTSILSIISKSIWTNAAFTLTVATAFISIITMLTLLLPDPNNDIWPIELGEWLGAINPAAAMMSATGAQTQLLGLLIPAPLGDFFSARQGAELRLPIWQMHLLLVALVITGLIVGNAWQHAFRRR